MIFGMFALFMRLFDDCWYMYEALLAISVLFENELSLVSHLIFMLYQWFEVKSVIAFRWSACYAFWYV